MGFVMLEKIINKVELPCFVYDLQKVREQISRLKNSNINNLSIFYAMKSNPVNEILRLVKEEDLGVETTSIGEIERAFLTGFRPEDILVTGPGKTNNTLDYAIGSGVGYVIVESLNEARKINQLAKNYKRRQSVLIRISPTNAIQGEDLKEGFALFGGKPVKYGIDEEDLPQSLPEIINLQNLSVEGIHVFAASGISDYRLLIKHVDEIFNLVKSLDKSFPQLRAIDFGGGFGYSHNDNYKFGISSYFSELNNLTQTYHFGEKKLFLELGTYISASCGAYIAEIVDVKHSRGEYFIIVNGGIHHLLRPSLVSNHTIHIYNSDGEPLQECQDTQVNIVGNLCHPMDILSRNTKISIQPKNIEKLVGGKVAILNCGAYGSNFSVSGFSLHDNPKLYVINTNGNLQGCLS